MQQCKHKLSLLQLLLMQPSHTQLKPLWPLRLQPMLQLLTLVSLLLLVPLLPRLQLNILPMQLSLAKLLPLLLLLTPLKLLLLLQLLPMLPLLIHRTLSLQPRSLQLLLFPTQQTP